MVEKKSASPEKKAEAPSHSILSEIHALAEGGLKVDESHGHGERVGHVVSALEAIYRLTSRALGKGEAEAEVPADEEGA